MQHLKSKSKGILLENRHFSMGLESCTTGHKTILPIQSKQDVVFFTLK